MGYEPRQQPEPDHLPEDEGGQSQPSPDEAADQAGFQPVTSGDLIGRTFGGRYRFEELLGEGTFARVFRVYDIDRRVNLAAKVLRSDVAQEPAFLERFRREARVLERLQHPHIVRYYDIVEGDGQVFILTDFIAGQTLQNVLRLRGGPLTPGETLAYLAPLAAALHYAHKEGVVHRDLKPANILIDANNQLYVTDFGIARILSDTSTLTVDTTVGTPHFMAPEQILSAAVTPATDVYALGVMLYQMLTGHLPFVGDSPEATGSSSAMRIVYEHLHVKPVPPSSLNSGLSEAVESVVLRCLEKDPGQRYSSVADVYDALADAIGASPVPVDAAGSFGREQPARDQGPEAEPVPTGVGGASQIFQERATEFDDAEDEWTGKPKRKPKPVREPGVSQSEKEREKQQESEEKSEEKEREKGWDVDIEKGEMWGDLGPSDRLSQLTWGSIVLWAGLVFLGDNIGATASLIANPMSWIFSGAGVLLLLEVAARIAIPEYRAKPGLRLVLGVVLLMLGLGIGISFATIWPLIIIAIGLGMLFNHLFG